VTFVKSFVASVVRKDLLNHKEHEGFHEGRKVIHPWAADDFKKLCWPRNNSSIQVAGQEFP
jgi:hypothetical protein